MIQRIWAEGIGESETRRLAQVLMDSVGPRLAGSPEFDAAGDWLLSTYEGWGVPARKEEYGTWIGWRQGALHVDMVAPRTQTLEAELLAYSPGNDGPAEGDVVVPPAGLTEEALPAWLETVAGKYVLTAPPEPMCRAPQELEQYARPETVARVDSLRQALRETDGPAPSPSEVAMDCEPWRRPAPSESCRPNGREGGESTRCSDTETRQVPSIDLSCEDYGMSAAWSRRDRLHAFASMLRPGIEARCPSSTSSPSFEGPSCPTSTSCFRRHLDSWHAATGATDNGTGTITMLEAMRILKAAYPSAAPDDHRRPLGRRGEWASSAPARSPRTTRR